MKRIQVATVFLVAAAIIFSGSLYAQSLMEMETVTKGMETLDSGSTGPSPGIVNSVKNAVAPGAPAGPNLNPPANPNTNRIPGPPTGNISSPPGPPTRPGSGPTIPSGNPSSSTPPGGRPGTPVMAPIDRKVEVAPGAFIPTQAAQQANRAFFLMHTKQFDDALKAYKGAMQYDETKYKPIYERVNSFFEKVKSSSDRGKAFSEVEETVLSEDPVPIKVKDYYVWQKLLYTPPQAQQKQPEAPGPSTAPQGRSLTPNSVVPSGK